MKSVNTIKECGSDHVTIRYDSGGLSSKVFIEIQNFTALGYKFDAQNIQKENPDECLYEGVKIAKKQLLDFQKRFLQEIELEINDLEYLEKELKPKKNK